MRVEGLIEVIVYVEDMQAEVVFYRDVLGLDVLHPQGVERYDGEYWVTLRTGQCVLALHGGGQRRQGADAPKIVFGVADVAAARDELLRHGVAAGEVRTAAPGVLVCDAADPEGNRFSLESRSEEIQ